MMATSWIIWNEVSFQRLGSEDKGPISQTWAKSNLWLKFEEFYRKTR